MSPSTVTISRGTSSACDPGDKFGLAMATSMNAPGSANEMVETTATTRAALTTDSM